MDKLIPVEFTGASPGIGENVWDSWLSWPAWQVPRGDKHLYSICWTISAFLQHDLTNAISESFRISFWFETGESRFGATGQHFSYANGCSLSILPSFIMQGKALQWAEEQTTGSAVKLLMQRSRTGLGWTWVWKVALYHAGQIYVWILFLFMYFSWPLRLRLHCD